MTDQIQGTDKGVVPTVFVDEVTPPPRPHPDAWVDFGPDGGFCLRTDDPDDGVHRLAHAEIVPFMRLYAWPHATLTFRENGGYTVEPPAPAGAEQVMIVGEPDTMAGDVGELVDFLRDNDDALPGDSHLLSFYTWTDESWRFDAETGKLTRCLAIDANKEPAPCPQSI